MNGLKRALQVVMNIVLWVLIIVIAFFAIVTFSRKGSGEVMHILGYTPMTVLSDSMAPEFHKDDLIIVRQRQAEEYRVGDIISFWTVIEGQRSINTHRIASVFHEGDIIQYTTKGDANLTNDSYLVVPGDIIGGFVVAVPFLGKVLAFLSTGTGFLLVIVLPLLAFFLYQLYRFVLLLIDIKRQTVIDATKQAMAEVEAQRRAADAA
ncbi:MAG: signal peptidase I, partial [Pseudoflavonifractor sp.]